ncbi:molybdenum cofactor biosynthesis protein B [Vibrio aphrogenes]|uniref:molybdenum cofactor biosynthesis protein B n=1 Tax=Vibrio aphrogenes TaxID=1891186 RepID=UPI000B35BD30|nr:molybdenum cofactor biosynthesis protein B [Vibrio aphrogenes]
MARVAAEFKPAHIAVMTVSDSRTADNDTSGDYFVEQLQLEGHHLAERHIVVDNKYQIRAQISQWIADESIQVILISGGTGFTAKNYTTEAVLPLFDKPVEGFGEIFRMLSFAEIGSSSLQSRAIAGMANQTVIFAMPGSTGACRLGWEKLIKEQLDARHRPCNFMPHLSL